MATETNQYISNPFKMVGPSANALGVNISTLFALLGVLLLPVLGFFVATGIGLIGRDAPIALGVAAVIGFASFAAFLILALLAGPAFAIILLAAVDNQKVALKPTLAQARKFIWRALGISVLTALAILGGYLLFVIPGFIFSAWFSLSLYALVKEDLGVMASMKRSRELVRGRVFEVWSVSTLPALVYIVPFLGGLLNVVLSIVLIPAMALRYQLLTSTTAENRPGVHWSNYAIVIGAIIATAALIGWLIFAVATGGLDQGSNELSNPSYYTY